MTGITCPKGHTGSQIRKLSAIYRESSGTVSGLAASYQSDLAAQVAPPDLPGPAPSIGCTVLSVVGIAVSVVVLVGSFESSGGIIIAPLMGVVIAALGFSLFITWSMSSSSEERARRFREREVWDEAYYCGQHDLVFVPGHDWEGPPTATLDLCREVAKERTGSQG